MECIYWTWSKKGEHLEKSHKSQRPKIIQELTQVNAPQTTTLEPTMFTEENNREINYKRLSNRKLITNTQINPYLTSNNYLNDISVQDKFLRPKNSNFNVGNKDLNDK